MGAQTAGDVEKYSGVVFIWHARVPMITQSSAWFAKSCLAAQANPGNTPSSHTHAFQPDGLTLKSSRRCMSVLLPLSAAGGSAEQSGSVRSAGFCSAATFQCN